MSWIDDLIGYKNIIKGLVTYPSRSKLEFKGDVTVTDNPATGTTEVEITGGGGGGGAFDWSEYPATQDVDAAGHTIYGLETFDENNPPMDMSSAVSVGTLLYVLSQVPQQNAQADYCGFSNDLPGNNVALLQISKAHYLLINGYITIYIKGTMEPTEAGNFDFSFRVSPQNYTMQNPEESISVLSLHEYPGSYQTGMGYAAGRNDGKGDYLVSVWGSVPTDEEYIFDIVLSLNTQAAP